MPSDRRLGALLAIGGLILVLVPTWLRIYAAELAAGEAGWGFLLYLYQASAPLLVLAAVAAHGVGWLPRSLTAGSLLALGAYLVATGVIEPFLFPFRDALSYWVPLVGAILIVLSGAVLTRRSAAA